MWCVDFTYVSCVHTESVHRSSLYVHDYNSAVEYCAMYIHTVHVFHPPSQFSRLGTQVSYVSMFVLLRCM